MSGRQIDWASRPGRAVADDRHLGEPAVAHLGGDEGVRTADRGLVDDLAISCRIRSAWLA
jgi:hypothetical protein